jgi:hypothetical protein
MIKNLLLSAMLFLGITGLYAQQFVDVHVTNTQAFSQISSDLVYLRVFKDGELHLDLAPHNTSSPINLEIGFDYILEPYIPRDCSFHDINAYDLYLILSVILAQIEETDCFLKLADLNFSGGLTSVDYLLLQRFIISGGYIPFNPAVKQLGYFTVNESVNCDFNPTLQIPLEQLMSDTLINLSYFILGDPSSDALIRNCDEIEERDETNPTAYLEFENIMVEVGNEYQITGTFSLEGVDIAAAQFGLFSDNKDIEVLRIQTSTNNNSSYFEHFNIVGVTITAMMLRADNDFTLTFKALKTGRLSDILKLDDTHFVQEVYDLDGAYYPIEIRFLNTITTSTQISEGLKATVYPNPITHESILEIQSVKDQEVSLEIYDSFGKMVEGKTIQVSQGLFHIHDVFKPSFKPGMYVMMLRHSDGIDALKVIVRK